MASEATRAVDRFDLSRRLSGVSWPGVLLGGVAAFVVGYLLTVLVVLLGGSATGDLWGVVVLLAFVFYSAHSVPVAVDGPGRVDMLEMAAQQGTAVPVAVYYAIPILVLLATSALVAVRYTDRRPDPVQSLAVVFGLTVPYALLAVAGTFVFTSETMFQSPGHLVATEAVLFGLVFPAVCGVAGAGLVGIVDFVRSRRPNG